MQRSFTMLKKRLIPVLIMREGKVVQSLKFQHTNIIHAQASIAVDHFSRWAVDEMIVLDVSRSTAKRDNFYETVTDLAKKCFVPLSVGGWVTSTDEVKKLLRCGADKVVINTEAVKNPEFIRECAEIYGSQCIVISIDVRRNESGENEVFVDRGREATGLDPVEWAKTAQQYDAGELFITSIEHDGAREGYNLELIGSIVKAVDIPVIAYGGVSTFQHFVDGIEVANADAVSAANFFHYTDYSAKKAKEYMRKAGVDVR